uniref:Protein quiver n=2 Tax=Caenorhabditis tropicalis TaxID=1561998 RepID=A0A1I7TYJ0_9PELO
MILPTLLLFLLPISVSSLECFTCGVFLSAPEPMCRGEIRNNSCAPENLGCLSIIGHKADGTYYVEKRCAEKTDDLTDGCINIGIRGIAAKQCLCRDNLCNSSPGHLLQDTCLGLFLGFFYLVLRNI